MRSKFDAQLRELGEKLTLMGAMCEEAIANSAKALLSGDSELAKKLAPLDLEIDRYERDIEALCLRLLLQQQPVARDLRQISAALKMITDLERIGDQAGDIAEIIPHLGGKTGSECAAMRPMAEAAIGMVTDSIEAYNKRDLALARSVIEHDDVVDDCFLSMKTALIEMIRSGSDDAEYALDLLMIAKSSASATTRQTSPNGSSSPSPVSTNRAKYEKISPGRERIFSCLNNAYHFARSR